MGVYVYGSFLRVPALKDLNKPDCIPATMARDNIVNITIEGAKILVMGLSFKENCPDIRNTKVVDLIEELKSFHCAVDVYDPWVNKEEANNEYNLDLIDDPSKHRYDAIVLAVAHDLFKALSLDHIKAFGKDNHVIYDIKYLLGPDEVDGRL